MDCKICFEENIQKEESIVTKCNHSFHIECIKEWIQTNLNKENTKCPYCRTNLGNSIICFSNNAKNNTYKTKNIKRKTVKIDGQDVSFINKQLHDQVPKAWLFKKVTYKVNDNNSVFIPLYILTINNEDIYITLYFRLYLLYGLLYGTTNLEDNIESICNYDISNKKYLDINVKFIGINFKFIGINVKFIGNTKMSNVILNICFDWCYDVFNELKYKFNIEYPLYYNSLVMDLTLDTIQNLELVKSRSKYQAVLICSIYLIIKKFNNLANEPEFNFDLMLWYTNNTYSKEDCTEILKYQQAYLDTKISVLTNLSITNFIVKKENIVPY